MAVRRGYVMSEENSRGAGVARAKRPVLIAAITVAALVLAGAGVWGAITIRDNRLTNEAQGYLEAVWAQEQLTQAALSSHLEQFEDAQASLQALQPSEEMLQARPEMFDDEPVAGLTGALEVLTEAAASPVAEQVQVDALFDADAGTFVEQYRSAPAEDRNALAASSQDAVGELRDLVQSIQVADADLDEAVTGAESAALAIVNHLPDRAATIAAEYPEAEDDVVHALHTAAAGEQTGNAPEAEPGAEEDEEAREHDEQAGDNQGSDAPANDEEVSTASADGGAELDPAVVAERIASLPELLIAFTESADDVRDSHERVLDERAAEEERARIAAEEARAAEQRAQQNSSSGGGSGSSGGVCTRFVPSLTGGGSLVLVPCP